MFNIDEACVATLQAIHRETMRGSFVITLSDLFPLDGFSIPKGYQKVIVGDLSRRDLIYSPSGVIDEFGIVEITAKGFKYLQENGYIQPFHDDETDFYGSSPSIPAADRMVSLKDNQVIELSTKIDRVIEALQASNSATDELKDEKSRLVSEISAGQTLLQNGRVRVQAIYETLFSSLKYVLKRVTDEGVTELVKVALSAAKSFFGIQ